MENRNLFNDFMAEGKVRNNITKRNLCYDEEMDYEDYLEKDSKGEDKMNDSLSRYKKTRCDITEIKKEEQCKDYNAYSLAQFNRHFEEDKKIDAIESTSIQYDEYDTDEEKKINLEYQEYMKHTDYMDYLEGQYIENYENMKK